MAPEKSQRRLGRGLDALFNAPAQAHVAKEEGALREIPITQIARNPFQPRKNFKPAELHELQESLQGNGLLQPVTVRPAPNGKGFELIAGERRLRAATNLGWSEIPAVVKDLSDKEVLTLALVENLQRSDLNPIEEAEGYDQLIRDFGYTQQTVADLVGKDRSTVANVLRILHLPDSVRTLIQDGQLSAGQARPLLGLDDPARIATFARQVVEKGWSAREIEKRVRETSQSRTTPKKGRPRKVDERPAEIRSLEQRLRKHLQTDVTISLRSGTRGSVVVDFYSADDLERVMELMGIIDNPQ
ncbi:MAG: ParB/RepB/Spo0J family partition protein [Gemmatimonadales bacterium]